MKAVRIHAYGGWDRLTYEEAPRPAMQADDVLIRVHAASVNPVDWKIRAGYMAAWINHTLPLILGVDVAGVVAAVGANVTTVQVGDSVYAQTDIARDGAYAEYVAVPAAHVAAKPQSLDFIQTAAVPLAGTTAWQALLEGADLAAGQTVLIHAAAGGVGHLAVQIAHWRGAQTIGTASRPNHDFLRQLGVDEVIDYTATPFEEVVHDVDVVLDTIGGATLARSWAVLKPGGLLISLVEPPSQETATEHGVQQRFFSAQPNGAHLARLAELIDGRQIKPVVAASFPLQEAQQAHQLSQRGHTRGKIVLQVV